VPRNTRRQDDQLARLMTFGDDRRGDDPQPGLNGRRCQNQAGTILATAILTPHRFVPP
jgi:hypothetical protein